MFMGWQLNKKSYILSCHFMTKKVEWCLLKNVLILHIGKIPYICERKSQSL